MIKENTAEQKPFVISKKLLWQAYMAVKANNGAAGVDSQSIADFEVKLKDNLYKLWNRMSSGTCFPPPVRAVEIPKKGSGKSAQSGTRTLGIPTVGDRIAQTAVKMVLEPQVEPLFHPDSYGYRPGKSAIDAVGVCRERCWRNDWVVDLDIRAFFDSVDHGLVMDLVKRHTQEQWMLLLIERWLKAPMMTADGKTVPRDRGTPQGSPISPLLANIVMHYVFDEWMKENFPNVPFERYADDVVVHARTQRQAEMLKGRIGEQLKSVRLQLHPDKTQIVYCKDNKRKLPYDNIRFDFCGFTFRPRRSVDKQGEVFLNFLPAMSDGAIKAKRSVIKGWDIGWRSDKSMAEIAMRINPVVRGWINYYGRFYASHVKRVLGLINRQLVKWARRKYKRLRSPQRAWQWLMGVAQRDPKLFAHWRFGAVSLQLH